MAGIRVGVDNFARAETDRMFGSLQAEAGGVNVLKHNRVPTPVEHQPVIRMNRDTLYSVAVADISEGATVTIPDGGDRYVSVMVVNQDHYINRIFHRPGEHRLTIEEFDTPWVVVGARILVDPGDTDDVAAVNALQDAIQAGCDVVEAVRRPAVRRGKPRRNTEGSPRSREGPDELRPRLRREGGGRSHPSPARNRSRMGRSARSGGGLHQLRAGQADRRVHADRQGCPRRRLLVDLALQRGTDSSNRTTETRTASTISRRHRTPTDP